jgi:hypothetical protein
MKAILSIQLFEGACVALPEGLKHVQAQLQDYQLQWREEPSCALLALAVNFVD